MADATGLQPVHFGNNNSKLRSEIGVARDNSLFAAELIPTSRVLFFNANVYDGSLQARFLAQVCIQRNEIVSVEPQRNLIKAETLSDEAFVELMTQFDQVYDLQGNTLMPGLVEGHAHISFPDSFDFDIPPEEHTLIAAKGAKKLLGFTSAFSAASAKYRLDGVIRDKIYAGDLVGPRLRACSPEITATGGLGAGKSSGVHESDSFGVVADGPAAIRRVVATCAGLGLDTVKINISGEELFCNDTDVKATYSEAEVEAAVDEAHKRKLRVAAHARGIGSVKLALKYGVDVIYHADFTDEECIAELSRKVSDGSEDGEEFERGIFLGPSIGFLIKWTLADPEGEGVHRGKKLNGAVSTYKRLRKAQANMVHRCVIGGDYGLPVSPQGENAYDIQAFVEYLGFTPIESLHAATGVGGDLVQMKVGRIKPGFLADLLVVRGDPTTDYRLLQQKCHIAGIMQDGRWFRHLGSSFKLHGTGTRGLIMDRKWADLVFEGTKCIETREYPLLDYFTGVPVFILEENSTKGDEMFEVIGSVIFESSQQYSNENEFADVSALTCVEVDHPRFGWTSNTPKYGWRIYAASRIEGMAARLRLRVKRSLVLFDVVSRC